MMKLVKLLHNPGAGEEVYTKKDLVRLVESQGFECRYSSTKKEHWEQLEPEASLCIVAGGDGTVRKAARLLLEEKKAGKNWPIGLLPLGTANNIANTLGIEGSLKDIIQSWHSKKVKKFDVGIVDGLAEPTFFLEGFGFGIFPALIRQMRKMKTVESDNRPEKKLTAAQEVLYDIIESYEARHCTVMVDGKDYSGNYLLIEIMNTQSLGPNLYLAPQADVGDGELEVVLVTEDQRHDIALHVLDKAAGKESPMFFTTIRGKNIQLYWDGYEMHADDELFETDRFAKITITVQEQALEFLSPA